MILKCNHFRAIKVRKVVEHRDQRAHRVTWDHKVSKERLVRKVPWVYKVQRFRK